MLEITEKILASIYATPMTYNEIKMLPYLKTISEYGIDFSIERLLKEEYIIEKVTKRYKYRTKEYREKYGEVVKTQYHVSKKGEKYLIEHGYLD